MSEKLAEFLWIQLRLGRETTEVLETRSPARKKHHRGLTEDVPTDILINEYFKQIERKSMAGKKPLVISGREFAVLKLLWDRGPLTVREIRGHLTADEEIPYTSVLSLLQLMERKKYLGHKAEGKTYRYMAKVKQPTMTRLLLRDFVGRFFDGSPEALVMGLAETSELDPQMWEQLQEEVQKKRENSHE